MDLALISSIAVFATIVLVIAGLLFLVHLTMKYETLAREHPEDADKYREKRKTILRIYLRVVVLVFIIAAITAFFDTRL